MSVLEWKTVQVESPSDRPAQTVPCSVEHDGQEHGCDSQLQGKEHRSPQSRRQHTIMELTQRDAQEAWRCCDKTFTWSKAFAGTKRTTDHRGEGRADDDEIQFEEPVTKNGGISTTASCKHANKQVFAER